MQKLDGKNINSMLLENILMIRIKYYIKLLENMVLKILLLKFYKIILQVLKN